MAADDIEFVFAPDGDQWVPSPVAAGPWSADALHGGPSTALVGRLLADHEPGDTKWFLSRLTVELIRPVPMAPLAVAIEIRRPGRRVQVLDAVVTAPDGTEVLWARGVRLAEVPAALDESTLVLPDPPAAPDPDSLPGWKWKMQTPWLTFAAAYDFLPITGAPFVELGPASIWSRLKVPLFAGQEIHPLDRVLTLADFPNGFGSTVPMDRFTFINPDLTVTLHRLPAGEWVLLDAHSYPRAAGYGMAHGILADRDGVLGVGVQTLLISDR